MKIGSFNIGKSLVVLTLVGLLALYAGCSAVSFKNTDVGYQSKFKKLTSDKSAAYSELIVTISGKAQVSEKVRTGFTEVVEAQMNGRKDAEGLAMKWIQEANPAAGYKDVVDLYKDLSRAIEAKRGAFLERETMLSSVVENHDNFVDRFPNLIWAAIFGTKRLEHKPIINTRTENAVKTGKDDNLDVFQK